MKRSAPIVKEINALLATYRGALTKLMENRKQVDGLITEMGRVGGGDHQGRRRHEGRSGLRPAAARIRIERIDHRDRKPDPDARDRRLPARRRAGAAARPRHFAADDRDVQGDARTRRRQFRSRAARPRPQGRTRRDGRRGRGIQDAGGRQGRTRCGDAGSAEQGEQRGAPRRADSFRRRVRGGGRLDRRQCLGLGRAARNRRPAR